MYDKFGDGEVDDMDGFGCEKYFVQEWYCIALYCIVLNRTTVKQRITTESKTDRDNDKSRARLSLMI